MGRFRVISNRTPISGNRYRPDPDGGAPIRIDTSLRTSVKVVDMKKVYGNPEGVVAEFSDINMADIVCEMLNNRVKYRRNKAFLPDDLFFGNKSQKEVDNFL